MELPDKDKKQLRQDAKALRQQLDSALLSRGIRAQITQWPAFEEAQVILAYAALPQEIDIMPLLAQYPQKQWYLPRIVSATQMAFHQVAAGDALVPNAFGIPEPLQDARLLANTQDVAMVFVPALMLDQQGYRLGFGRGYYDRFLPTLPAQAITACLVPQTLWTVHLPKEAWDKPVAWGIHENGLVHFQG